MPTIGPDEIYVPAPGQAANVPADMALMATSLQGHLVGIAADEADRNARYADVPPGSLVSCPQRRALWQRTADGWHTLAEDTGWITTGFSAASGWEFGDGQVRRRNGVVDVRFGATRTGSAISATSVGNIVDSTVLQIPTGFTPSGYGVIGIFRAVYTSGSVRLTGGGNVIILDMHPNSTIAQDENLRFSFTFLED